eukprot:scaffold49426_cov73-Phaeocystis_antarctica.AAC.4
MKYNQCRHDHDPPARSRPPRKQAPPKRQPRLAHQRAKHSRAARRCQYHAPSSVLALNDVVGQAVERRRAVAKLAERLLGLVDQLLRHLSRALEPKQLRVGGLVRFQVLARGLAKVLCARGQVQDVVGHLERKPDLLRVYDALLDLRVGGARQHGA